MNRPQLEIDDETEVELFDTDAEIDIESELAELVDDIAFISPVVSTVNESKDVNQNKRPDQWVRTRQCWCGECRFYSVRERPVCPYHNPNDTKTHWLWATNPEYINRISDEELALQMKDANVSANIMPISPEDNR